MCSFQNILLPYVLSVLLTLIDELKKRAVPKRKMCVYLGQRSCSHTISYNNFNCYPNLTVANETFRCNLIHWKQISCISISTFTQQQQYSERKKKERVRKIEREREKERERQRERELKIDREKL